MRFLKTKAFLALALLVGVTGALVGSSGALPQEDRAREIRREYYTLPGPVYCGASIRTCQGQIIRDGCAEDSPPPPNYDVHIDPCF
ncbi:MAG: hypothetical protein K0U98_24410 [Deltaproteobacteria bacterium]|nr:hypothetical protein [Deltaproteobacteria bacterium]